MQFDFSNLEDAKVYDPSGERIGKVDDVFYDEQTRQPEWLLVDTGVFSKDTMIPIVDVDLQRTEDGIRVPFSKDQVKNAPDMGIDEDYLDERQERELYDYYGIPYGEERSGTTLPQGEQRSTEFQGRGESAQEMTRSEEVLGYRKVRRPSETVRLRKRVVTENVQQTVPVEREEVVVERVPVGEGDVGPIGEGEQELTLSEEDVIPEKHVEAKDRIRVDKQTVTDEERLSEELRKEEIDVEREDRHEAA